ncbi:MAG: hypothetical protein K9N09_12345 [Candidatus Cloacimonetes bacterium]|nr:hypothetical protein [Candidatus Cloacimonadota bacterium]MCF7815387.1 hypothetical protein [Candidatus Cloacimonadota bacterium]MCF7869474.1 hypothetical protein [Candidatus Cloacimonadota bacterium]MCF7884837.1 hypothetical protein [Candidatus Cloacimonadota bacterium]
MAVFNDNYFTNDSYAKRSERLKILKNYIDYWSTSLSIPRSLVDWGLHAYDKWEKALKIAESKKSRSNEFYQEQRDADEKTFKYYLKCKRLVKSTYSQEKNVLRSFGVDSKFPRNRADKIAVADKFIRAYQNHMQNKKEQAIPQDFVDKLIKLLNNSLQIAEKIEKLKKEKTEKNTAIQIELFKEDARKLRSLYSWALMTWEPDNAYLFQLGFAVKSSKNKDSSEDEQDEE